MCLTKRDIVGAASSEGVRQLFGDPENDSTPQVRADIAAAGGFDPDPSGTNTSSNSINTDWNESPVPSPKGHGPQAEQADAGAGSNLQELQASVPEEELNCVVCLTMRKTVVLLPCRHLCTCKDCVDDLQECPMCRTAISASMDIFL